VSQEDSGKAEVASARASVEELRADLEAERQKAADRLGRFDAQIERLEAKLGRSEQVAAERREALSRAQAQLRRPLVRASAKATRILDRLGRVALLWRRPPRSHDGPTGAVTPASTGPHEAAIPDSTVWEPLAGSTGAVADPRTIAIHIAPQSWEAAATWGDTHFALGLQRAFERQGWSATVHIAPEADSAPAVRADVALHLFGRRVPPVRPGQLSVLWIISHPDEVRASLARDYDLVFAASDAFADELGRRIHRPVRPLHQATDPDQFHPDPSGPRHELLFIGNSRNARRPILDALAGTDHDLAVYGGSWSPELLDPKYLRGAWIPNDELHRYYSSAEIVLNDHWADMRAEGFISNRVYDVLASGGFVVSDGVPGMDERFDGGVATFDTGEELIAVVERFLADPAEREARATRGRAAVLARHTFDHRAATIIEATRGMAARRAAGRAGEAGAAGASSEAVSGPA